MVPAVLVLSHGHFCEELVKSAFMIYGETERVEALPLVEGEDPEEYLERLQTLIEKYENNVFVLVDLIGGTPFNSLVKAGRNKKISALGSMSMPMLLDVLLQRENYTGSELAKIVTADCGELITDLCPLLERASGC